VVYKTMVFHLTIKKNEIMSFAQKWMAQKTNQTQKHKYHMLFLIHGIWGDGKGRERKEDCEGR
jgi:regulatory protein YycI of two-component signal transduction system YycFG